MVSIGAESDEYFCIKYSLNCVDGKNMQIMVKWSISHIIVTIKYSWNDHSRNLMSSAKLFSVGNNN